MWCLITQVHNRRIREQYLNVFITSTLKLFNNFFFNIKEGALTSYLTLFVKIKVNVYIVCVMCVMISGSFFYSSSSPAIGLAVSQTIYNDEN